MTRSAPTAVSSAYEIPSGSLTLAPRSGAADDGRALALHDLKWVERTSLDTPAKVAANA